MEALISCIPSVMGDEKDIPPVMGDEKKEDEKKGEN